MSLLFLVSLRCCSLDIGTTCNDISASIIIFVIVSVGVSSVAVVVGVIVIDLTACIVGF